jgi:hypothetical protein
MTLALGQIDIDTLDDYLCSVVASHTDANGQDSEYMPMSNAWRHGHFEFVQAAARPTEPLVTYCLRKKKCWTNIEMM